MWVKNATIYDSQVGADVPKNAADFKRVLQALTKPDQNFFAIGSAQSPTMLLTPISAMFGAPNNWRLQSSGELTSTYETGEFKEAVGRRCIVCTCNIRAAAD